MFIVPIIIFFIPGDHITGPHVPMWSPSGKGRGQEESRANKRVWTCPRDGDPRGGKHNILKGRYNFSDSHCSHKRKVSSEKVTVNYFQSDKTTEIFLLETKSCFPLSSKNIDVAN